MGDGINLESGACHELRTLLNVINGLAELLLGGKTGRLNHEQRACIGDILASGRKILKLIEEAPGATPGELQGKAGISRQRREIIGKEDSGS